MNRNKKESLKNWLFIIFLLSMGALIYYTSTILPNKYRKEFIEELKNNDVKEAYFYDYIYFDTSQLPKNENNIEILKWLKRMKPSNKGELCRNCSILNFLSTKKIDNPKVIKEMLSYLDNWDITSKGEYISNPFLLKIILKTNKVIWLKLGKSNKTDNFIIDFNLELKEVVKYHGIEYLFFKESNYGEIRAPKLEKFFDKFKLSEWKKENRRKLNARNKNRDK